MSWLRTLFVSSVPNKTQTLDLERGLLDSFAIATVCWGVLLTLAAQCTYSLLRHPSMRPTTRASLISYSLVMLALGSVAVYTQFKFCVEQVFVDDRNYPGGPLGFDKAQYNGVLNVTGVVACFMMNWLADGLVLFRLYIIWERRFFIVVGPSLMLATSFSLSIIELYQVSKPGANMYSLKAINFGLLYWSFSIALNIVVTALIVSRLLFMRRRLLAAASSLARSHAAVYTSVSALLVESAGLYSAVAIMFLVAYGLQSPVQYMVESVEIIQGICPLMIILRVAKGHAYSGDSLRTDGRPSHEFSTFVFADVNHSNQDHNRGKQRGPEVVVRTSEYVDAHTGAGERSADPSNPSLGTRSHRLTGTSTHSHRRSSLTQSISLHPNSHSRTHSLTFTPSLDIPHLAVQGHPHHLPPHHDHHAAQARARAQVQAHELDLVPVVSRTQSEPDSSGSAEGKVVSGASGNPPAQTFNAPPNAQGSMFRHSYT